MSKKTLKGGNKDDPNRY